MLRSVLYGLILGCALALSAWMGMSDARATGQRSALRITAPVLVRPAAAPAKAARAAPAPGLPAR